MRVGRWIGLGVLALTLVVPAGVLVRAHGPPAGLRLVDLTTYPFAMTINPHTGRLFIVNSNDNNVSVLAISDLHLEGIVPTGPAPDDIALDTTDNLVFVSDGASGTVNILNANDGTPLRTVTVLGRSAPHPSFEHQYSGTVAIDPNRGRAVLAGSAVGPGVVRVLDLHQGRLIRTVPIGGGPFASAVDPVSGHAFVTSGADDAMRVLDLSSGAVVRTVSLAVYPTAVLVDTGLARAFVANGERISVLDTRNGDLRASIPLPFAAGSLSDAILDPRRHRLYLASIEDNAITTIDTAHARIVRTVHLRTNPPWRWHLTTGEGWC